MRPSTCALRAQAQDEENLRLHRGKISMAPGKRLIPSGGSEQIVDGKKKVPHPERAPERSEGEQSKDAMPAIQRSREP
jgi:hypothetical protein